MASRNSVRAAAIAALVVALSVPSSGAGDRAAPGPRPSLRAQSLAVTASGVALQQAPVASSPAQEPGGFWRSRRGAAVAVMMAAVTGYVIYSRSHDRVKSPAS